MSNASMQLDSNHSFARRSDLLMSLALLGVIVVLLIPLPSYLLDMLLAFNLGVSLLLLLVTLGAHKPLEMSVFPSLLLLLTLYRLSLNVATTRLILLDANAGKIVSTFGGFIVGDSLVVGVVIFLILVIIQFIVITKGASRISEVNARFVLDALPGKQMSIDAEVNSGAIDDEEAKERRADLSREAEFYGAMDGAGKYVRGDAIAGIVITAVNIVGGVIFGMTSGFSFTESIRIYSTLTVGDGLVSQIPALIIATTAGILVTKASTGTTVGQEVGMQMLSKQRPLLIGACIMIAIAFTPGLPKIPFIFLAVMAFIASRYTNLQTAEKPTEDKPTEPTPTSETRSPDQVGLDELISNDRIRIEIGTGLFSLMEKSKNGTINERIASVRRELAGKHGLWVPVIRVRDNLQIDSQTYRLVINGRAVAESELYTDQFLAIKPDKEIIEVAGEETTEPAFGLPAKWISASTKQRAEMGGYTVVDPVTVLITHLSEAIRKYAHELLSREDLQKMLDRIRESAPALVDEIKPDVVRMATLRRVLCLLLQERVSISSLEFILESIVHHGSSVKDPAQLADRVREDIGSIICQRFLDENKQVRVIVMDPNLESRLRDSMQEGRLLLPPNPLERLITELRNQYEASALAEKPVALLTDGMMRRPVKNLIDRALPDLAVISYTEIPTDLMIEPVNLIKKESVFQEPEPATNPAGSAPAGQAA